MTSVGTVFGIRGIDPALSNPASHGGADTDQTIPEVASPGFPNAVPTPGPEVFRRSEKRRSADPDEH